MSEPVNPPQKSCPNCKGKRLSEHKKAGSKMSMAVGRASCLDCWRTYDIMPDGQLIEAMASRAVNSRR